MTQHSTDYCLRPPRCPVSMLLQGNALCLSVILCLRKFHLSADRILWGIAWWMWLTTQRCGNENPDNPTKMLICKLLWGSSAWGCIIPRLDCFSTEAADIKPRAVEVRNFQLLIKGLVYNFSGLHSQNCYQGVLAALTIRALFDTNGVEIHHEIRLFGRYSF